MKAFAIMLFLLYSCNPFYKAGNLRELGYAVNSTLATKVVRLYIDSLIADRFAVPEKWEQYNKLVDIDSANNKRIYFKKNPEEMYLVSLQGNLIISDVFNPHLKSFDWVADTSLIGEQEKERIIQRLETEVLSAIEAMAKKNNLPDSLIYK